MKSFVQFGAGNIGRSFLGQLFSQGGYEVIFVDIDEDLVNELNRKGSYRVIIKDTPENEIVIQNVRAVQGSDIDSVADEIASCDLMGTSVGKGALPFIMGAIARGLDARDPEYPLDIIIAENIQNGADYFIQELMKYLPGDFDFENRVGLIETSIGKMVPIMTDEDLAKDRLWVFAEKYNTLILDRKGFKNPVPDIKGLAPKENIKAYVDRKLFIHNLGHAACAYTGHMSDPAYVYLWEVMEDDSVVSLARTAMEQARDALIKEYPEEFSAADLDDHIMDLLKRFANPFLKDTVFRVGRDVPRKLGRNDRLTGGMVLCAKHGLPFDRIARSAAAALLFKAEDEHGNMDTNDIEFQKSLTKDGFRSAVCSIMGLDTSDDIDKNIFETVENFYKKQIKNINS
jgi:mannitol-1-phosphate 5-dehydrogenase